MSDHHQAYQDWVAKNQNTECAVCYGRGWVSQEDAWGRPTQEVVCPYCYGRRNQSWAPERREGRFAVWGRRRNALIIATVVVFLVSGSLGGSDPYSQSAAYGFGVQLLLWGALIAGWALYLINRRPKEERPGYRAKHAPGFTDDHERNALGLFAIGLAARQAIGHLFKDKQ